jgi:sulfur dioxygenase
VELFDSESSTYTCLIVAGVVREALLIDPVKEHVSQYHRPMGEPDLKLARAIDTHTCAGATLRD